MSGIADEISRLIRREWLQTLASIEAKHGKAVVGIAVEAALEASTLYLRGSVGAEATFNVLTRHADEVGGELISRAAGHQ